MSISMRRMGAWVGAVVLVAALGWAARATVSRAEDMPPKGGAQKMPAATLPADGSADLKQLDTRIKSLHDEYHGQLDPLQAQVKALRDKYDPQISDLETQRKTVAEARKPEPIQDLDRREESDLTTLAGQEKDEMVALRAKYVGARKAIEQKYGEQRKEVLAKR